MRQQDGGALHPAAWSGGSKLRGGRWLQVEEWKDHYDSLEEEDLPALDFSKFPSIRNKKKKQVVHAPLYPLPAVLGSRDIWARTGRGGEGCWDRHGGGDDD